MIVSSTGSSIVFTGGFLTGFFTGLFGACFLAGVDFAAIRLFLPTVDRAFFGLALFRFRRPDEECALLDFALFFARRLFALAIIASPKVSQQRQPGH